MPHCPPGHCCANLVLVRKVQGDLGQTEGLIESATFSVSLLLLLPLFFCMQTVGSVQARMKEASNVLNMRLQEEDDQ